MRIFKRLFARRQIRKGAGIALALELNAASIAQIETADDGQRRIMRLERIMIPVSQARGANTRIVAEGELEGLTAAARRAQGDAAPEYVVAGLDGSLAQSSMFRAVFEREQPQEKITESELRTVIEKAERALRGSVEKHLSRAARGGLQLIDSTLEEVLLDGYSVPNPIGLVGKEVEVALFNTYAGEATMEFLRHLQRLFNAPKLITVSTAHALCRAFIQAAHDAFSAVFIGLGEAVTNVSVVARGRFMGTKTFSVGRGIFVRALGENLRLGAAEAANLVQQYVQGSVSQHVARRVSNILRRASSVWGSGVELALEEFRSAVDLFPATWYIYGPDAKLKDLAVVLADAKRFADLPFFEQRTITVLEAGALPFAGVLLPADRSSLPLDEAYTTVVAIAYLACAEYRTPHKELERIVQQVAKLAYT